MNFSELNVYLIEGAFYKCDNKIYLVGARVPAIANVFVCKVTKDGDLGEIDAVYYRQSKRWKLLSKNILIKDKYKEHLQELFCYGLTDFVNKKRNYALPPVNQYLESCRLNTIKKYAISKRDENVDEFMTWVKNNCRYYEPMNILIYYIGDSPVGSKSDEELYDIFIKSIMYI